MKLVVKDRLMYGSLFPKESTLVIQTMIRDINEKISLSKEEVEEIEFKSTSNGYEWKVDKEKEIDFSKAEINFLKEQVDRLDKDGKITQGLLDLCVKIKNS